MTSIVKVIACCSDDVEVIITGTNPGFQVVLQDSEKYEDHVYDNRVITVSERKKKFNPKDDGI